MVCHKTKIQRRRERSINDNNSEIGMKASDAYKNIKNNGLKQD